MPIQIQKSRALASLNLTPLIDVVFLLLVFFLVASRFAQEDRELPVQLPSASSAMPMTVEPQEIIVNIDSQGGFFVDGKSLNASALENLLVESLIQNPMSQTVIIRGDGRVDFQSVVTVLDLCNRLGVPSYKITTSNDTEGQGSA
jgi:biopolymer transport protein ExbD